MTKRELVAFRTSPFSMVADESAAACWAGRPEILRQLKRVCRGWANRSDSTLDLLWANLGAGKTHALFHLKHLLAVEPSAFVVFVELPENVSHFLELYQRVVTNLPIEELAKIPFGRKKTRGELLTCTSSPGSSRGRSFDSKGGAGMAGWRASSATRIKSGDWH